MPPLSSSTAPKFTGPDLCAREAHEAVALLKAGKVTPGELLDAALNRITAVEPAVNAMPILCRERAIQAAKAIPQGRHQAGDLAGLSVAIKDLTPVAGVLSTFGTMALADNIAPKATRSSSGSKPMAA